MWTWNIAGINFLITVYGSMGSGLQNPTGPLDFYSEMLDPSLLHYYYYNSRFKIYFDCK